MAAVILGRVRVCTIVPPRPLTEPPQVPLDEVAYDLPEGPAVEVDPVPRCFEQGVRR
jgi:hypothetical protein